MKKRYFGTDGIRGKVGEPPITPDFMLKLGWACGRVFASLAGADAERSLVIIGKDTRVSGYMFESALEAGLVAAGVDVKLLGPMPTPAIALMTRTQSAQAGIVISASHNPFYDNGIKFFNAEGRKLDDAVELAIERELEQPLTTVDSTAIGKVLRVVDAAGRYIEYCKSTVPDQFTLRGMKIVVDCAHGATYHVAPSVFAELGAEVVALGVEPDGFNINQGVGSTDTGALAAAVLAENAVLGIALDGDGDRVIFVDGQGRVVDGDELLFVIACHRQCEGVVGTQMTNLGMELALRARGIDFARAKVGDRYVYELMRQKSWSLGGESSGHIICADFSTTGDGVVAALQVLVAMRAADADLASLCAAMQKLPQHMINVPLQAGVEVANNPQLEEAVAAVEEILGERGRVLLRPSGTEPLVRVMIEGEDSAQVEKLCRELADRVQSVLS
jgi:phosphoglucosamine mutase